METNRIFRGFCINRFGIGPLHYISSRSDFGFEFSEIFLFKKGLPDSTIRGVGDSLYQRYAESATLRLNDTGSRRLSASLIRGVDDSPHHRYGESAIEFFKKKTLCIDDTESCWLLAPVIRWVANSRYHWVGYRLHVSRIRRVDDSAYRWVGESTTPHIGDTGSCYSKKKLVELRFSVL